MHYSRSAILQALAANPWFAALPTDLRERMVVGSALRHLQADETLFRQGALPDAWYGVVQGVVRVSTLGEDGGEHILALMEAGTWIGESALIVQQPHLNYAAAQVSAQVLAMPREVFDALMDNATFARAVAQLVTTRYRLLHQALGNTSLRSTRARIAYRLLQLAHGDVVVAPDMRRRVQVSQESLAMMVGITRQTLSSEMKWLVQQGVVRLGYRCIEVLSEETLHRISGMPLQAACSPGHPIDAPP